MLYGAWFALLGYLSGSVLFAHVFSRLFHAGDVAEKSPDKNPGTTNAFRYGGFACGALTLLCDVLKGALPVFFYLYFCRRNQVSSSLLPLVMAAPVFGHAFPLFRRFKGGKGIAVTFGTLAGLLPMWRPLATLAAFFILFSCVLKVTPHYHRTIVSYLCTLFWLLAVVRQTAFTLGFLLITGAVGTRMLTSKEEKEKMRVRPLWMH